MKLQELNFLKKLWESIINFRDGFYVEFSCMFYYVKPLHASVI